ncbi:hypothetical protein [Streptomyces sp. NBC_00648]|uniref:hypothetical protein n=1 Tax=Streptomyces sp. NBC_00648 TaxID=2975797 RepID=UPI00324E494E
MPSVPGLHLARRPPSDRALLRAVRDGRTDHFRHLYHRHYRAAHAYAASCMPAPMDAHALVCHAFEEVLNGALAQEASSAPYYGCLRQDLIDRIRRRAVAQLPAAADRLAPGFRAWAMQGALWPLTEDGHLSVAFSRLSPLARCLIWHSVIENDTPSVISQITGVETGLLAEACLHARQTLHRTYADLYLARTGQPACRHKDTRPQPDAAPGALEPIPLLCPHCHIHPDLITLDLRLEAQLPAALLAWWPGHEYLRTKEVLARQTITPLLPATAARHSRLRTITAMLTAPLTGGRRPAAGRGRGIRPRATAAAVPALLVLLLTGIATSVLALSGAGQF